MLAQKIVVVGGGIVGCMTALALRARGCEVTLVERNIIAAQTSGESSWAGAGILFPLLPWDYRTEVTELTQRGAALYPEFCQNLLQTTGIDPEYTPSGMLILPPLAQENALNWCKKNAVKAEICDLKTNIFLKSRQNKTVNYAELHADFEGKSALLLPKVAQVRPPNLLQALKKALQIQGVKLLERTQLKPLHEKNRIQGWQTESGDYLEADTYVVTSGAWSFDLLKATTNPLAIKPMRGQILLYQLPPNTLPHIIYQDGFYLVPRRDGYLLAGSTLEDVGFDPRTTEAQKTEIQLKAQMILPQLKNMPILKHWSGLRPGTPENLPTIARHPNIENLFLNTGHFRYGLTMAPASAERLSHLILSPGI